MPHCSTGSPNRARHVRNSDPEHRDAPPGPLNPNHVIERASDALANFFRQTLDRDTDVGHFPGLVGPCDVGTRLRIRLMAKSNTVQIKLVSTADTGFFYVTKKNARAQTSKLELSKYDPVVRKHVPFKEAKIK
jgi:large subunit ribosomal protein L33